MSFQFIVFGFSNNPSSAFVLIFVAFDGANGSTQDEKVVTEGRIIVPRDRPTREKEKQGMMQRGALSVDSGGEYLVGHGNNFLGSPGNLGLGLFGE